MIESTLKIARSCPLVIQGFSNFLGLFQVIMANPDICTFTCQDPDVFSRSGSVWIPRPVIVQDTEELQWFGMCTKDMQKHISHIDSTGSAQMLKVLWIHKSGQIIATSHDRFPQNGGLVREIPLFQGNLGWWNILIWPHPCISIAVDWLFFLGMLSHAVFWKMQCHGPHTTHKDKFYTYLHPRSLTVRPCKVTGPQKERIVFQPSFFRGELLNFMGVLHWLHIYIYILEDHPVS